MRKTKSKLAIDNFVQKSRRSQYSSLDKVDIHYQDSQKELSPGREYFSGTGAFTLQFNQTGAIN